MLVRAEPKLTSVAEINKRKLNMGMLKREDSGEAMYIELKARHYGESMHHSFQMEIAILRRIEPNPRIILTE